MITVMVGLGMSNIALSAATNPQEIFTELSAPAQPAAMSAPQRAETLPALALLPAEGDMVAAIVEPGEAVCGLMQLCGKEVDPLLHARLESIRDTALVLGEGSAAALLNALPFLRISSSLEMMRECEEKWCERAKPEFVDCIRKEFRRQWELEKNGLLTALERFHPAPIYCALTCKEGREKDFAEWHRSFTGALRGLAQSDDGVQYVEYGGYTGIRMNQLKTLELMHCPLPSEPEVRRALAQREMYMLTRNRGKDALIIVCERPGDISLPPSPAFSMLYSPKLAHADGHMEQLLATVWIGTSLNRAMRAISDQSAFPAAQAVVRSLRCMGTHAPKQQQSFHVAADQLAWLISQPPFLNELRTPLTMQVWQNGDEVWMESVSDAQGMTFAPGKLRLVNQSEARETIFYMESTAFSTTRLPLYMDYWNRMSRAILELGDGMVLSLRDDQQGTLGTYLRYARLFRHELEAIGEAMHTISSGMEAPFSVLLCHPAEEGSATRGTSWAFGSAVKNRLALGEGWRQLLDAVGNAAGKLGVPPALMHVLPIEKQDMGNAAVSYALALPFAQAESLPRVAVNNKYFVLGNADSLNAHVLSSATGSMSFCGAVNSVHFPRLAQAVRAGHLPIPTFCCDSQQESAAFLERLAERVNRLYSVSTISSDVRTARALMFLAPRAQSAPAPEEQPAS